LVALRAANTDHRTPTSDLLTPNHTQLIPSTVYSTWPFVELKIYGTFLGARGHEGVDATSWRRKEPVGVLVAGQLFILAVYLKKERLKILKLT